MKKSTPNLFCSILINNGKNMKKIIELNTRIIYNFPNTQFYQSPKISKYRTILNIILYDLKVILE